MTTKKAVHVALYDTMADWEIGHLTAHVNGEAWQREPGRYKIVTVGASDAPVTTAGGLKIVPDITLAELTPADSAMLVLPGADTWLTGGNTAFAETAREFLAAGVGVAAICGATLGLANAGLLDDRAHTSNAAEFLAASGYAGAQHYQDELAVIDGRLVTATAIAPVEFARAVFEALDLFEPHVLESWYKLYGQHDPAGYFELVGAAA